MELLSATLGNMNLSDSAVKVIGTGLGEGKYKNIIIMAGAGISVSAGIPDFRSPGTGLYDNLQKYDLPRAEAIFDINFFRERPKAFCTLAKELYPGGFRPTPAHFFMTLLEEKKVLRRCFTQNIDGLEYLAGLAPERVVQAHGGFQEAHCIDCKKAFPPSFVKETVFRDEVPYCSSCGGLVKPDIVFFGEGLPQRFHTLAATDFKACDLLIVMGTSLAVQPFASLIDQVPKSCPRLLINLQKAGEGGGIPEHILAQLKAMSKSSNPMMMYQLHQILAQLGVESVEELGNKGFKFDTQRDTFFQTTTDDGCMVLSKHAGWCDALAAIDQACAIAKVVSGDDAKESKEDTADCNSSVDTAIDASSSNNAANRNDNAAPAQDDNPAPAHEFAAP